MGTCCQTNPKEQREEVKRISNTDSTNTNNTPKKEENNHPINRESAFSASDPPAAIQDSAKLNSDEKEGTLKRPNSLEVLDQWLKENGMVNEDEYSDNTPSVILRKGSSKSKADLENVVPLDSLRIKKKDKENQRLVQLIRKMEMSQTSEVESNWDAHNSLVMNNSMRTIHVDYSLPISRAGPHVVPYINYQPYNI